jgi:exopolysaccharide biosynthesis protein
MANESNLEAETTDLEMGNVNEMETMEDVVLESTISIEQIEIGTGVQKITYYIADVFLGEDMQLVAAFAKNSYGTNITEKTSAIAEDNNAIFAINGDYYGFREDGIMIRNGVIYRDEGVRTGVAFYKDGNMQVYDETMTTAEQLVEEGVINTYSFGPGLISDGEIIDGIDEVEIDTNFGNHSIQGDQPRSAIGMISENHYIFLVVDGRSEGYSKGMTLTEVANVLYDYGCVEAYNLDGGGSSTMYYEGELVNNPLGKDKERATSDILMIRGDL